MKKKVLALIALAALSTSSFAVLSTGTYVDPLTKGKAFQYTEVFSKHDYFIPNDTSFQQTVSVCYVTTTCPEFPQSTQSIRNCDQITVEPGHTAQSSKMQDLKAVYNFQGTCNVHSETEINGWQHHKTAADGKMQILR